MKAKKALLASTLAAVVAGTVGFAAPAQANTNQGYVAGSGAVTDDFGDEGPLSRSSYSNSGAAGLWQLILWADGAKESDGTNFDYSDVDCAFGSNTDYATKDWQRRYGLTADGIVGTATFGRADAKLTQVADLGDGQIEVRYNGSVNSFRMYRNGYNNGSWSYAYIVPDWDYSFTTYNYAPADC